MTEDRWPVDWEKWPEGKPFDPETGHFLGAPPAGHPRRCQGSKLNKDQCGQWAVKGSRFCKKHGGHMGGRKRLATMGLYSNRAGDKLKKILKDIREETGDERMSLAEEVDVSRALCQKAVHIFEVTCVESAADTSVAQKDIAISCLKEALTHVGQMVERHAKVLALSESVFDPDQIDWIIGTFKQILNKRLEDEPMLLKMIMADIDGITVPEKAKVNINIT